MIHKFKAFFLMLCCTLFLVGCGETNEGLKGLNITEISSNTDTDELIQKDGEAFHIIARLDYENEDYAKIHEIYSHFNNEGVEYNKYTDDVFKDSLDEINNYYLLSHSDVMLAFFEEYKDYALDHGELRCPFADVTNWFPEELIINYSDGTLTIKPTEVQMRVSTNTMPMDRIDKIYSSRMDVLSGDDGDEAFYSDGLKFLIYGEKTFTNKSDSDSDYTAGTDITARGLITDVVDLGNGKFSVTFTDYTEYFWRYVSMDTYNTLELGCKLPFDTYLGDNFICYDDSNGFYFSQDGIKDSHDWETIWISDENINNEGTILVYYSAPYAFNGFNIYSEQVEKGSATYTIDGNLDFTIRTDNKGIKVYKFKDFVNDNIYGDKTYLSNNWRNLYIVDMTIDENKEITRFVEQILAG